MAKNIYAEAVRLIALVPHRDAAAPLEAYRRRLFAAGFSGAYSFPAAAPLAAVSRAFTAAELKALARSLRESAGAGDRDGKMSAGGIRTLPYPPEAPRLRLFGLALDLAPPDFPQEAVICRFSSLALCLGFLSEKDSPDGLPPAPPCVFRAAMTANIILRPLGSGISQETASRGRENLSFEWKIGVPVWLPKYRRPAVRPGAEVQGAALEG